MRLLEGESDDDTEDESGEDGEGDGEGDEEEENANPPCKDGKMTIDKSPAGFPGYAKE